MDNNRELTPHDALELNEVMNGGMAAMKMMQVSMDMVQDPDLKAFMQQSMTVRQARMKEMQSFISNYTVTSQLQ